MEKIKNFHKNRFFQKSFISHFEALLMSFPIIETLFLYFEFLLEIYPELSEKSEMQNFAPSMMLNCYSPPTFFKSNFCFPFFIVDQ